MRRLWWLSGTLAVAWLLGIGVAAVPASADSCCYTLQDQFDGNYIVSGSHGNGIELFPTPGNEFTADLVDCALKYTGFSGWHTYCLYEDPNTGLCMQAGAVGSYVGWESCNSTAKGEYDWHDGNWIVNLGASQGNDYNAYLQAYDIPGYELVKIFEGGGAEGPNQWIYN